MQGKVLNLIYQLEVPSLEVQTLIPFIYVYLYVCVCLYVVSLQYF